MFDERKIPVMKRFIALILALILTVGAFAGCGKTETPETPSTPADTTTQTPETPAEPEEPAQPETPAEPATPPEPQLTDEEIIQARRDAAMEYVRKVCSVRWRSDTDVTYVHSTGSSNPFKIIAGRLYEGIPYSYSGAPLGAWLDHPGTMDEKGIYNMTGLNKTLLNGTSGSSRIGIDCSSTVNRAWQSFGSSIRSASTDSMTSKNGYIHVGDYEAPDLSYINTREDCAKNGQQRMYEAYALLQMSDAVVMNNGSSGHAMFVVGVNVVRAADGTIDGIKSTCTVIDQNGIMRESKKYYDETVGEDVYVCLRVDYDYTFAGLYSDGYLPITCKELIDPAPVKKTALVDSQKKFNQFNVFSGTLGCTQALEMVKIVISDASGKELQSSLCHPMRRTEYSFSMSQFQDDSEEQLVGKIDLKALTPGTYHVTVTARTVQGEELVARDYDLTVEAT